MIQAYREVKLSTLASLFPQPITDESRKRNLQGFLVVGSLCVKLLWFPLVKYWIRQSETGHKLNRRQRHYYMIALERTQWKGRNLFMVTFVWVTHALPFYWSILNHVGNSDFKNQNRLLSVALFLFQKWRLDFSNLEH